MLSGVEVTVDESSAKVACSVGEIEGGWGC